MGFKSKRARARRAGARRSLSLSLSRDSTAPKGNATRTNCAFTAVHTSIGEAARRTAPMERVEFACCPHHAPLDLCSGVCACNRALGRAIFLTPTYDDRIRGGVLPVSPNGARQATRAAPKHKKEG